MHSKSITKHEVELLPHIALNQTLFYEIRFIITDGPAHYPKNDTLGTFLEIFGVGL